MNFLFILAGLPVFFIPDCMGIYPACMTNDIHFNFKVTLIFVFVFPYVIWKFKYNLTIESVFVILLLLFLIYIKNAEIYPLILIISLSIFVIPFLQIRAVISVDHKLFLYSATVASLSSIMAYIIAAGNQYEASLFLYSYLNYWNDTIIILFAIAMGLSSADIKRSYSRRYKYIFFLVCVAVLLSASRASIVFLIFVAIGHRRTLSINNFVLALLISFVSILYAFDERFSSKIMTFSDGDPFSGRIDIWRDALSMIEFSNFFGNMDVNNSSLHSTFIDVIYIFGPISLVVFGYIFRAMYILIAKVNRPSFNYTLGGFILGPFMFNVPLRQVNIFSLMAIYFVVSIASRKN